MKKKKLVARFRVAPGSEVDLKKYPTDWTESDEAQELGKDEIKDRALAILEKNREELAEAQELLYASDTYSVLLVFQAMDAAGKDGTIRHVMSGVNPQGCQVFSFKKPSAEELDHNFLWRYMKSPARARPHRHLQPFVLRGGARRKGPPRDARAAEAPPGQAKRRVLGDTLQGHQQLRKTPRPQRHAHPQVLPPRFQGRAEADAFSSGSTNPEKHWKFSAADLAERAYWKDYRKAFEEAITATSTKWAPWYVIPADRKYVARALVADIITTAIARLDLEYPEVSPEQMKELEAAREQLENEPS